MASCSDADLGLRIPLHHQQLIGSTSTKESLLLYGCWYLLHGCLLCSMGWVSVVLSTAAVIGTSGLIALYSFATADADLSLLLRGKHKPGAFKDKVVWVTGASQVCMVP